MPVSRISSTAYIVGLLVYTPSPVFTSLYSTAEHDQPNVYQSVIVLVDVLPVSPLTVLNMHMLNRVTTISGFVASWSSLTWHRS